MPTVTLKAHYVLPPMTDTDHEDWSNLSVANLARAYGDDEPEYEPLSGGQRQDQAGERPSTE